MKLILQKQSLGNFSDTADQDIYHLISIFSYFKTLQIM
jgi:hypothetical protein